ncbi:SMP-30/gluconolactonase/LRE family protein [Alkalibacterium psychrotolerans]
MTKTLHDQPELVFYAGSNLLEGPVWDEVNSLLYFVSIPDEIIYCFDPDTTEVRTYRTDGPVGAAVLDEDGMLLSAEKNGLVQIDPETGERSTWLHPNTDERMRYNDGKMDPAGRFLIGTMGAEQVIEGAASLYSVKGESYRELLSDLSIANGLGWSEDGNTFYHIDTPTKKVKQFDYDLETGNISNGRECIEVTGDGNPDGMCVDTDGMLWVAEYGGGQVCKWNPENGEKIQNIQLPVTNATSCCIGGKDKDTLYITTAKEDGEELSGGLFEVTIR